MISAGIVGLGMSVPEKVLSNADLSAMVDTTDEWIVERTGIRERRISAPGQTSGTLGAEAARQAVASAKIDPAEVDLVICATISPDMQFPATASIIQNAAGCSRAAAFDLSAGCSGFAYALAVGSQLISSGAYKNILVVGADVLSKSLDWTDRSTCVLFGDGAGAALLAPVEQGKGVIACDLGSDGSGADLLGIPAGGGRMPASEDTIANRMHYIKMDGREVFRFAVKIMGESAERALAKCGMVPSDVDLFIPHQANVRIIDSSRQRLGLPEDKVFVNVQKYGNTSAASIPIALCEARESGRILPGDVLVTVGFGAGLTWGSCVLVWTMPPASGAAS